MSARLVELFNLLSILIRSYILNLSTSYYLLFTKNLSYGSSFGRLLFLLTLYFSFRSICGTACWGNGTAPCRPILQGLRTLLSATLANPSALDGLEHARR